jgi:hypothetical protein
MKGADARGFNEAMEAVFDMYLKPKPSHVLISMYFEALRHIPLEDVLIGISSHVKDTDQGTYLPKPADILRNIQGNTETQAQVAWTKVDKAIRSVGSYQTVVFDDGLIHAVIDDMGGWVTLCAGDLKEYPFKQNQFITRYRGYVNKPPITTPSKLIGISEASNSALSNNYRLPPPVLVGDHKKALALLATNSNSQRVGISRASTINEKLEALTDGKR